MVAADPEMQVQTFRRARLETLEGSGEVVAGHNVECLGCVAHL